MMTGLRKNARFSPLIHWLLHIISTIFLLQRINYRECYNVVCAVIKKSDCWLHDMLCAAPWQAVAKIPAIKVLAVVQTYLSQPDWWGVQSQKWTILQCVEMCVKDVQTGKPTPTPKPVEDLAENGRVPLQEVDVTQGILFVRQPQRPLPVPGLQDRHSKMHTQLSDNILTVLLVFSYQSIERERAVDVWMDIRQTNRETNWQDAFNLSVQSSEYRLMRCVELRVDVMTQVKLFRIKL